MTGAASAALAAVVRRSRPGRIDADGVDVHFHPDALTLGGTPILDSIASARRWSSQFETGTSNGGLTACPGGDRWRWESALFGGAYDGATAAERPLYGGLRRSDDPRGSAPRFGSAHLRLSRAVLDRTTLCFPDSVFEPDAVGTAWEAGAVIDAVAAVVLEDPLDRYIEAHIHGGLELDAVESIVFDPRFGGTEVESAARALGRPITWHPGYVLQVDGLRAHDGYHGLEAVRAAERIALDGLLTPAVLGEALRRGDIASDVAKHVWHLIARFAR